MGISLLFRFILLCCITSSVNSEPLSEVQGDAILKELKDIRKLLQSIDKKSSAKPAGPKQPTIATVSTLGNPVLGDVNAPITLVEFTDYQCTYCARFVKQTLPALTKKYIETGKVRLVLRDMPLGFHADARLAARSAHCAGEHNQYWEMHDLLFKKKNKLKRNNLEEHAKQLGIDGKSFAACLDSDRYNKDIDSDIADANKVKITGTPSFVLARSTDNIITGKLLIGARPLKSFEAEIEILLKQKK